MNRDNFDKLSLAIATTSITAVILAPLEMIVVVLAFLMLIWLNLAAIAGTVILCFKLFKGNYTTYRDWMPISLMVVLLALEYKFGHYFLEMIRTFSASAL